VQADDPARGNEKGRVERSVRYVSPALLVIDELDYLRCDVISL